MGFDAIFNPHNWAVVPFHFWSLVFFVFGCIVGSFLNVCIYRMPLDLSVVTPPSHCPHCKYSIPFYLNIPLVTWLTLRGRCKNCGAPISPRYFAVELLTGLAFLACWLAFGRQSAGVALVYSLVLAGLIVATFIDFEHFIIPDEITLGGAAAGFVISIFLPQLHGVQRWSEGAVWSLVGIAAGAGVVYAVLRLGKILFGRQKFKLGGETKIIFTESELVLPDQVVPYEEIFYRKTDAIVLEARRVELIDRSYRDVKLKLSPELLKIGEEEINPETVAQAEVICTEFVLPREAMGLGDVKFMAAIGAFLGWQGALFSLMASSVIGSVVGVTLIIARKREWSSRMPYGPYIALAAVIWMFGGRRIMATLFPGMG
jgi:leader peptidase (prepilin peptidase)/N-methyltransferase